MPTTISGDGRDQRDRPEAEVFDFQRAARNVLGMVAHAFQHARNLERGDDLAQVAGDRRAQRDQLDRQLFDFRLDPVELLVACDNGARLVMIAMAQRVDRCDDLAFGQAAHLRDQRIELAHVGIDRTRGIFVSHGNLFSLSQTGR